MLIGIDLGTTNSLVACFRNGKAEIIPNRLGKELTPSIISVDADGKVYVGETAKERGMLYPLETARVFKRSMGTNKEYILGNRQFNAVELSSLLLRSLKEDAEVYLGEKVTEAIISVPAYFNDLQRKATKKAGELAGLKVHRIINEPTAAAIAFGMDKKDDSRYLVFDLGGGTFDVSILELYGSIMEVHAIAGDNYVGGEDFTEVLCKMFLNHNHISSDLLDIISLNEIYKVAETCKCAFSTMNEITMSYTIEEKKYEMHITLDDYEDACSLLLDKLRRPIERSLKDAGVTLNDIDQVILVGGATKLPIIRRFVSRLFGNKYSCDIDPDKAVALGVALQCGMKARDKEIQEVILTDVCPYTLGTEIVMHNGMFDETGHYLPIIERNTVIPVSRTQTVYTAHDNQTQVNIKVLQGESRKAYFNLLLGEISVPVPAGPKGKEAIDITYTYDVNALLEVEVYVHSTGIRRKVIIQNEENQISDEEATIQLEKLQYLKQNPRDEEVNQLLLLQGERLYQEMPEYRYEIDRALTEFEQVLARQNRTEIELSRKKISQLFNEIDTNLA